MSGSQDAEVTKSLCVVPEISIYISALLTLFGVEGWGGGGVNIFWNNTWYEIINIINYFDLQKVPWLAKSIIYMYLLLEEHGE